METILVEWEAFAATLFPAAANMTSLVLRDHAKQILEAAATDLSTHQTKQAQTDKSLGRVSKLLDAPETAAQTHAVLRARSGFDINQLASEYRALRTSVLCLWMFLLALSRTRSSFLASFFVISPSDFAFLSTTRILASCLASRRVSFLVNSPLRTPCRIRARWDCSRLSTGLAANRGVHKMPVSKMPEMTVFIIPSASCEHRQDWPGKD
jgi:hypothetical protein